MYGLLHGQKWLRALLLIQALLEIERTPSLTEKGADITDGPYRSSQRSESPSQYREKELACEQSRGKY